MEVVLTVFAWMIQIGITVLIALLFGWILMKAEGVVRRKRGHLLPWTLTVFAVICAVLAALALNPPVVCPDEYEDAFNSEIRASLQSVSRGIYSDNIPLVPACVQVTSIREYERDSEQEHDVDFTIRYLYFGQVDMSYSSLDGYNIEKPLSGLS